MSSSSDDSSWEQDGEEHPKYYKEGGYHPVKIGDVYNNRYKIIHKLGWGYFSTVWMVTSTDPPHTFNAIKIQKSKEDFSKAAEEEIEFLQTIGDHPNVISLIDSFKIEGPHGTHVCMIFPVLGDTLHNILCNQFSDLGIHLNVVKVIIDNVKKGLSHIHSKGIIHTDLKVENILVKKPNNVTQHMINNKRKKGKSCTVKKEEYDIADITDVVICDLGTAIYNTDDDKPTEIQTSHYMAPEVLLGYPYDYKIDYWSLGCVAYELLTDDLLFSCDSDYEESIAEEENHLASIVELKGKIPQYMIEGGIYSYRYINIQKAHECQFKHIKNTLPQSIKERLKCLNRWTEEYITEMTDYLEPLLIIDINKR